MSRYRLLIGALVLLITAYTINVLVRSNSSKTVPAVAVSASKAEAPKGTALLTNRAPTNESHVAKPMSKSPERAETVQSDKRRKVGTVGEFASLPKEEQLRQIIAGVDLTYKKVIPGLGLGQSDQEKLRSLLIERELAQWDAHDIATADAKAADQDSLNRALELADMLSDDEMAKTFSAEVLNKIHLLLEARPYIMRINQHYDPALAQAGIPLTPEQVLPLAKVLYHTFGSPNNPQIEENRRQVDPVTGMTPLDLLALERAKTVLTQAQLEVVKQKIAALNRTYYLGKKS